MSWRLTAVLDKAKERLEEFETSEEVAILLKPVSGGSVEENSGMLGASSLEMELSIKVNLPNATDHL